jgi:hypothetical protein
MRSSAFVLIFLMALVVPAALQAAQPASGTLTDRSGPISYSSGPFLLSNATPIPEVDNGPECNNPQLPCDDYALTIALPAGYGALHPNAAVRVTMGWTDTGTTQSNYDLYVYKGTVITTDGSEAANHQSSTSANPEIAIVNPLTDGSSAWTVKVVPAVSTGETVHVTIELLPGSPTGPVAGFGGADPTVPGAPRYQIFVPPAGSTADSSQGEFNIGFDPKTHRILVMNTGPIWRVTPAEVATGGTPEACPALWEDKSTLTLNIGLDPILITDRKSGRTLASNSTAGANAVYAYSDNDGDSWTEIGAGPPNGGADHETLGTGPLPAAQAALSTLLNQGENTLYCSQDVVGPASCQRSLDLGMSWAPGVLAYEGNGITKCGGLHGHLKIGPDGTAWLPVNQCAGQQGGAVSTDGGLTWSEFIVEGALSQPEGADPSIGIDSDGTAYYCYVNNELVAAGDPPEGHVHVKVSHDHGATWVNDFDIGASHGIRNGAETEAVGGSSGRAACGFLGSDVVGDYQSFAFPGNWYAFIATTYDAGQHWVTVNATPNDPVQRASGIWQQGGGQKQRNLLDFNEITLDDQGRVLYGFSDGCVSPGCVAGTAANDFVGNMRVARQIGGESLLASMDTPEPAAPKRACLAGSRDPSASHLTWAAPDNGGADISVYQIFRSLTSTVTGSLVGQVSGTTTSFDDTTIDPSITTYFYTVKASNTVGASGFSNEVGLTAVIPPPPENVCTQPGLTELTDPAGDTSAVLGATTTPAPPGADLLAFKLVQPYETDGTVKLVFNIYTDNGESPQPPGTAWYVAMRIPDPAPANTFHYRGVHMAWNGPSPVFESYLPGANNGGGVDGRFVTAGSTKPADPSSSYVAPFNHVIIVVNAGDLGLAPGDTIAGFVSGVSQTAANAATALYDQMPNSLSYTGSYTVRANQMCAPESIPVAILQATPNSGCTPLTVNLDGSQSFDQDGDAITTYTFDFADGSAKLSQSTAKTTHTYTTSGGYPAALQVVDERGVASTNAATAKVNVAPRPATPVISAPSTLKQKQTGVMASVADHVGSQYSWSIQNGQITAGQGTSQITFTAGTKGNLSLSVIEISSQGCLSATGSTTVAVK